MTVPTRTMNLATAGAIVGFMGLTYAYTVHKLKSSVVMVTEFSADTPAKAKPTGTVAGWTRSPPLMRPWARGPAAGLRGGDGGDGETQERDQQLIQQLQQMRGDVAAVSERMQSIEREMEEHAMAAEALEGFDGARACHRAVGGVLTEQTVGVVRPSLLKELEMLSKAHAQLGEKLAKAEGEMAAFQERHKIRVMPQGGG